MANNKFCLGFLEALHECKILSKFSDSILENYNFVFSYVVIYLKMKKMMSPDMVKIQPT